MSDLTNNIRRTTIFALIVGPFVWAGAMQHDAQAKATKRPPPAARVMEGFTALTDFTVQGPPRRGVRLPPSSAFYLFDHDAFLTAGRASFHKECSIDLKQDPAETSCRLVWAAI